MSTSQRRNTLISADGLLDGARDAEHLHVDGLDAVIDQDHDAGEIRLREDGDGETEDEGDAGEGEAEHHDEHGAGVGLNELGEALGHFARPSGKRRRAPSGRP